MSDHKEVMSEQEFKLRVIEDLATLKAEMKALKHNRPICEKDVIKAEIKTNRRLNIIILVTYIPLLISFIAKLI